jgi:hypothetical protein
VIGALAADGGCGRERLFASGGNCSRCKAGGSAWEKSGRGGAIATADTLAVVLVLRVFTRRMRRFFVAGRMMLRRAWIFLTMTGEREQSGEGSIVDRARRLERGHHVRRCKGDRE